jgi:hypothetical protein
MFQVGDRRPGPARRLVTEGAQLAASVTHHRVGLPGDSLGDGGKVTLIRRTSAILSSVRRRRLALIDRARDRTVRVLSASLVPADHSRHALTVEDALINLLREACPDCAHDVAAECATVQI